MQITSHPTYLRSRLLALVAAILAAVGFAMAMPQPVQDADSIEDVTFTVYFRRGSAVIDPAFANNAQTLADIKAFITNLKADSSHILQSAFLRSSVSPEGPRKLNKKLAADRAAALRDQLSPLLDVSQLQVQIFTPSLDGEGASYPKASYPSHRYASLNLIIQIQAAPDPIPAEPLAVVIEELTPMPEAEVETPIIAPAEPEALLEKPRKWHLKTNAIGWAMAVSNLAVEFDFAQQWSVAVPIYYSGVNYFKSTVKFRTLTFQPEVRYWLGSDRYSRGAFFVGAHLGLGWFNYALGGDYRIQDVDGNHPALGGGISAGYRMPLGKSKRWKLEFTLGAGVYDAKYDKWHNGINEPLYQGRIHTTFVGIDNAAISIVYSFGQ